MSAAEDDFHAQVLRLVRNTPSDELPPISAYDDEPGHVTRAAPVHADTSDAGTVAETAALRFVRGGAWILDQPDDVPAVWGHGTRVLWASGEPLMLCGPPGVGKTTLTGQVVRALLFGGDVLGEPVEAARGRILYLASDRPRQIARALRRHFDPADRATLDARLVVWQGPPPKDLAAMPGLLAALCAAAGATVVILDSLKDMAVGISSDDVGAGVNAAIQTAIAAGVEVLALHHQRKAQAGGGKPTTLSDVYGSVWLTAGAGSVILLWGQAGDPIVDLIHLKQPADEVGPLRVEHDHVAGVSRVAHQFDEVRFLVMRGKATAAEVASARLGVSDPDRNEVAKTRRRLERLVQEGRAVVVAESVMTGSGGTGRTYGAAT